MASPEAKRPRGWVSLYALAFLAGRRRRGDGGLGGGPARVHEVAVDLRVGSRRARRSSSQCSRSCCRADESPAGREGGPGVRFPRGRVHILHPVRRTGPSTTLVHPSPAAAPTGPDDPPRPVPTGPGSAEAATAKSALRPAPARGRSARQGHGTDPRGRLPDRGRDHAEPGADVRAPRSRRGAHRCGAEREAPRHLRRERVLGPARPPVAGLADDGGDPDADIEVVLAGESPTSRDRSWGSTSRRRVSWLTRGRTRNRAFSRPRRCRHELTHALDDQHFGLVRVDRLGATCQDERQAAALGAVEGSAQFFSLTRRSPSSRASRPGRGSAMRAAHPPRACRRSSSSCSSRSAWWGRRSSSRGSTTASGGERAPPALPR